MSFTEWHEESKNKKEVTKRIYEAIKKASGVSTLSADTPLDLLGIDSFFMLDFIDTLASEENIHLEPSEVFHANTVGDLIKIVIEARRHQNDQIRTPLQESLLFIIHEISAQDNLGPIIDLTDEEFLALQQSIETVFHTVILADDLARPFTINDLELLLKQKLPCEKLELYSKTFLGVIKN